MGLPLDRSLRHERECNRYRLMQDQRITQRSSTGFLLSLVIQKGLTQLPWFGQTMLTKPDSFVDPEAEDMTRLTMDSAPPRDNGDEIQQHSVFADSPDIETSRKSKRQRVETDSSTLVRVRCQCI